MSTDQSKKPSASEIDAAPENSGARRHRLYLAWTIGNVALIGVAAVVFLLARGTAEEPTSKSTEQLDETTTTKEATSPVDSIARADRLMSEGSFGTAGQLYQLALVGERKAPASLQYRAGICAELLGDFDTAMRYYRDISMTGDVTILLAAQLGQARARLGEGKLAEARDILVSLAAVSGEYGAEYQLLFDDVIYLMALTRARTSLQGQPTNLLEIDANAGFDVRFAVRHLLALANETEMPLDATTRPATLSEGIEIHAPGPPATMILSARIDRRNTLEVLQAFANQAGWQLSIGPETSRLVQTRQVRTYLRDATGSELLLLLLEPLGLEWAIDATTLKILDRGDISPKDVQQVTTTRATHSLRNVLAVAPDHELAPLAHLYLGNLAHADQQYDQAETNYREVSQNFPTHPCAQAALFNIAKLMYRQQREQEAKELFYRVVDSGYGSELEPVSYLFLGRILLDGNDIQGAIRELYRAVAKATDDTITSASVLTLASAQLLLDPPAAHVANTELMKYRDALKNESDREVAAVLSAWARFLGASATRERRGAGRDLVAALVYVSSDEFFSGSGYLLLAQMYRELGLQRQVASVYEMALRDEELVPSLKEQIRFHLAEHLLDVRQYPQSRELYLEILKSPGPLAPKALTGLAQLALLQNDPNDCLNWCRKGLSEEPYVDVRREILQYMGNAFQLQEDHYNAALCFSGLAPSRDVRPVQELQP